MRLSDPLRVELPGTPQPRAATGDVVVPMRVLRRPFALLAVGVPVALMVVGTVGALVSAHAAERAATEGIGTLGVELGAVLWFAGAVALGVRPSATLLRALILALTALLGAALVAVALVRDWTGAGLSLAMEFGVGALAVSVIDVVLLGFVHARIDTFASTPDDRVVRLRLGRSWNVVDVTVEPPERPRDDAD